MTRREVPPARPESRYIVRPVLDGEMVFVPGEIPRRGAFALWGKGSGSAKVELVFP